MHDPSGLELLKVSTRSSPNSVAGAVSGAVRSRGEVLVQVIGAGALNQAIKAVAVAREMLAPTGIDLVCTPSFVDVEIDGEDRTALRLRVGDRLGGLVDAGDDGDAGRSVPDSRDSSLYAWTGPLA